MRKVNRLKGEDACRWEEHKKPFSSVVGGEVAVLLLPTLWGGVAVLLLLPTLKNNAGGGGLAMREVGTPTQDLLINK